MRPCQVGPCHHGASSGCGWRNGLQIWRAAESIWISSRGQTARGGPPAWGVDVGLKTLRLKKNRFVTKTQTDTQTWKEFVLFVFVIFKLTYLFFGHRCRGQTCAGIAGSRRQNEIAVSISTLALQVSSRTEVLSCQCARCLMEESRFSSRHFFSSLTRQLQGGWQAKSLASHDRPNKSCPAHRPLWEMQLVWIVYNVIPFLDMLSPGVQCHHFRHCNGAHLIKHIIGAPPAPFRGKAANGVHSLRPERKWTEELL
jgi:hypothetical protein